MRRAKRTMSLMGSLNLPWRMCVCYFLRRRGVSHGTPSRSIMSLYPRTPCEVGWCAGDVQAIRTTRVTARSVRVGAGGVACATVRAGRVWCVPRATHGFTSPATLEGERTWRC